MPHEFSNSNFAASHSSASFDAKEQVRQATDIVQLIGQYVELRRQGRGYVAICPWHDDTRPSLQINPERQSWKCWVCDVGGDVFSFVQQRENVGFREALEMLAERAGIQIKTHSGRQEPEGGPNHKPTLYRAMVWAEEQYHQCLARSPEGQPGRDYFAKRGFTDETLRRFRLGYAPQQWQWLLDRSGTSPFDTKILEAIGLTAKSDNSNRSYDRFRGRVLFPIRDTQGRPIGMGGRILPEFADERSAKYINNPETNLYSKSDQLYGLDAVRDVIAKSRRVTVMEGYTDVLMAHQCGVSDAVAVCGTALGLGHIRLLRRFADQVVLVLDGDDAGRRRANEILELFVAEPVDLRILTLPENLDPCDFLQHRGAEEFEQLVSQAPDALSHKLDALLASVDVARDPHAANRVAEEVLSVFARAPQPTTDSPSAMRLRQQQMLTRLTRELQVEEIELRSRLESIRKERRIRHPQPARTDRGSESPASKWSLSQLPAWERELLEICVRHPDAVPNIAEAVGPEQFSEGAGRLLYEMFVQSSQTPGGGGFAHVMTETEDPALKRLIVELDESAAGKDGLPWQVRLTDLLDNLELRRHKQEQRRRIVALERGGDESMDFLNEIIEAERKRQGFVAPTDG